MKISRLNLLVIIAILIITIVISGCITINAANVPTASQEGTAEEQQSAGQKTTKTSSNTETSAAETLLEYDSELFKVSYPSNWQLEQADNLIGFKLPKSSPADNFQENVVITINKAQQGLSLDEHVEGSLEILPTVIEDFNLIEVGKTMLSGTEARKIVYTGKSQGSPVKIMQILVISGDNFYVITYSGSDEYLPNLAFAEKMFDSFTIKQQKTVQQTTTQAKEENKHKLAEQKFVGNWRVYSQAIFYDIGGNNWLSTPTTRLLELKDDKSWRFGESSGTWDVTSIADDDWKKWGVSAYGPTRKIILYNWNNDVADGPIEEDAENIDFYWVIYHVAPPTLENAAQIQMKFGRSY